MGSWPEWVAKTLPWIGVLLGCLLAGSAALYLVLRHFKEPRAAPRGLGMTLRQVREMQTKGEITPEEFEKLKRIVIAEAKEKAGKASPWPKPPKTG